MSGAKEPWLANGTMTQVMKDMSVPVRHNVVEGAGHSLSPPQKHGGEEVRFVIASIDMELRTEGTWAPFFET